MDELKTEKTEHNMHEKAQTRAEKRGILAVLGSADPIADE
jgi:HKD family nuclease